ncbi:uncharacterized protein EDB91DRAFT_1098167 [Suillus paluster]|uniref:uncharacterized protein n=1 Tax=Suillus paluster TaxID=48578 RepID=UPI001B886717|nr:uncharacterized protein EDB91DRAFT_1098167 [Suillus paluster]KAG1755277.1 hypothetical protein EDB91DRAFT_1098167 [Suillus paluster]
MRTMVSNVHPNGPDNSTADILQGRERIVSYPGTSQFNGRGISACGLAAMNFARVLSELAHIHSQEKLADLIRAITSKEIIEDIVSICSGWSSDLHLEVEDIQRVPLFDKSLKLVTTRFGPPQLKHFKRTLQYMQTLTSSATVIITRPPEIIACMKIKGPGTDVFVIFDSHPRPSYPSGAGLILSTSIDQAASRLASILPAADNHLLSLSGLQWQAQLLNNVSGHIFVSNGPPAGMRGMQQSVIESSLAVLRLQAEVAGLKQKNARLTSENEMLEGDAQRLEDALSVERKKVTSLEASSKIVQSRSARPLPAWPPNAIAGPSRLASSNYSSSSSDKTLNCNRDARAWPSLYDAIKNDPLEHEWELDGLSTTAAFELQQSFDIEDMQLRNQMHALVATIPHNFSCAICMEEQPADNSVELECNHPICRVCIRGHVCSKIEEHRFPVLCPVCMTEPNNRRPGAISGLLVQQIGVDERQYAIWEEMELSQLSVLLHCRKCQRSVPVDKGEHEESRLLICPLPDCSHIWCKACQQSITIGGPPHSCDGTSELDHLMKQRGWKYCPNCKTPVQRDGGCSHMTCISPGCNTHFCYICGENIVRSALRSEIQTAMSAHYRVCKLFDYPGE